MNNIKITLKIYFSIVVVLMLFSCTFEPWKTTKYIDLKVENLRLQGFNNLPDKIQYEENYLNGAFIHIAAIGKNATVYSSREPYLVSINLKGKPSEHINFTIDDLKILSSSGINYFELINDLPITNDFKTKNFITMYDLVYGQYSTDYIFNFHDDEIYISFLLEISTVEKTEIKEMFFTLTKVTKKGLFQSYW